MIGDHIKSERGLDPAVAVHRARFEAGLPPGARPFGWRRAGRGIEPDPEQAPIVAELYRRYIGGATFWQLTQWINGQGVLTLRGKPWNPGSLRGLLDNPVHAGLVTLGGQTRPGAHEPIVDEHTRDAYLARRRLNRGQPRREGSRFLLTGLVVCGACGHAMVGGGRARWPQYRCQHAIINGAHRHTVVATHRVESVVIAALTDLAQCVDAAAQLVPAGPALVPDMDDLAAQVLAADRKLAALELRRLDTPPIPEPVYAIAVAELTARRADLAAALEAERDRRALASTAPRAAALDLLDEWDELPLTARQAALRALFRRVVVTLGPDFAVQVERVV